MAFRTLLAAVLAATALQAVTVDVQNRYGAIHVVVADQTQITVEARRGDEQRPLTEASISRRMDRILVRATPQDSGPLDLHVTLPIGFRLEAETESGALTVVGMLPAARLGTETGDIRLSIPWSVARITLDADVKPPNLVLPKGQKFLQSIIDISGGRTLWRLRDTVPELAIVYGSYQVRTRRPQTIELTEFVRPPDWPIQFHSEAPALLERMLNGEGPPTPAAPAGSPEIGGSDALFRSDVRMVNMMVSVTDNEGRPVTGLTGADFSVRENGDAQRVEFAGSEATPFNLAILLDLSGSARQDREHLRTAAEAFIRLAGKNDRVAIYALANGLFHVVSPLSNDHEKQLAETKRLPEISGASPLYDAITLAYARELWNRPGERNALIVVSDGLDNQVSKQEAPSSVKFSKLVKAAEEMNALIYPVFLRSAERFNPKFATKARENMEKLAEASGGRLFPALSVEDLAPVFPEIEAELRSVYGLAYYPKDQDFNGKWRKVEIKVDKSRVNVRARPGYYAR
ncbi:MAG: VWA domain-containing protein [Bryobacterales bacterium]